MIPTITSWVLTSSPYMALMYTTYKHFPKFFTPSFVVLVFLICFVQAALIQHGSSVLIRLGLLYVFLALVVLFFVDIALHFVVGKDLIACVASEARVQTRANTTPLSSEV